MVRGGALALSPLLTAASQQLVKFRALLPELLAHRSLRAESGAERCRAVQSGGAAGCWRLGLYPTQDQEQAPRAR